MIVSQESQKNRGTKFSKKPSREKLDSKSFLKWDERIVTANIADGSRPNSLSIKPTR